MNEQRAIDKMEAIFRHIIETRDTATIEQFCQTILDHHDCQEVLGFNAMLVMHDLEAKVNLK